MAIKTNKKLLSIVIKNETIKIAEVSKHGKAIKVHQIFEVPTPEGSVIDGMIEDMGALAGAFKSFLDFEKITTRDVVFSLVSGRIATKEVIIPEVRSNKIAEIVNTNASEYFPVDIEQYIIRYTVLEKVKEKENEDAKEDVKLRLQVIAVPASLVEKYYTLAAVAGLTIVDIDYAGNSSYQLLRQQINPNFNVVINIEKEETVVSIFENNYLKMQRSIPYGELVILQGVQELYNLQDEQEAFQKLKDENFLQTANVGRELMDSMEYLISSINRITDYYTSRNGSRHFDNAYLVGEVVLIPGLDKLLSTELNLALVPLQVLQNVTTTILDPDIQIRMTGYVSNIGALIEPMGIMSKLNEQQESAKNTMKTLTIVLAGAVVVSILITAVPFINMLTTKMKLESVQRHIAEIEEVNEVVADYYEAKDKADDVKEFAGLTYNHNDSLHLFIAELEKKIPSDVAFSGMSVASGSVSVSGTASSKSSVAKLIQQLESIQSVANVKVSSLSEVRDNADVTTVTFSLTCTFGAMEETETEE